MSFLDKYSTDEQSQSLEQEMIVLSKIHLVF